MDIHYGLFRDVDLSRYQLVILVTPFLHNTHDTPALFYVPKVLHVGVGLAHQAGPVHDIVENILGTMINSTFMPRAVKLHRTLTRNATNRSLRSWNVLSDTLLQCGGTERNLRP